MAQAWVVRHGQASFGAANYDQLSELGWQQARWLGQWLAAQNAQFDRIVLGSLVRHRQTLAGICEGYNAQIVNHPKLKPLSEDNALILDGLNEYDSGAMFRAMWAKQSPQTPLDEMALSKDRRHYFRLLREALYAWSNGQLHPADYMSFAQFREGVWNAFCEACQPGAEQVLIVSSGGPISNIVGQVLQVPSQVTVDLNLQTRNASLTQLAFNENSKALMSFNNVPHLQHPERAGAITYS